MKLLITGATGFLGSHLVRALLKEGHEVIILKRSFSNTWRISDILSSLSIYNIDQCSLDKPFKDHRNIDAVIHTATRYDRNNENFSELIEANVLFPLQILEMASLYGTKLFINTDSFINKNNSDYEHLVGYALSKKHFLEWGKQHALSKQMNFINVRLEHIYGPFDSDSKFTTFILNQCLNNVPELSLSPGDQKRDFIYVDDVVEAYTILLKQRWINHDFFQEFELGTGESVTIRYFVELFHTLTNSNTKLKFGSIPHRENEIMESKANNHNLRQLGWKSRISLEEGINNMIQKKRFS